MIVVAAGWAFLALPSMVRRHLGRIHPMSAARLIRASLVAGLVLIVAGLVSMIAPTLFDGLGAHHLAAFCRRLLHDVFSGGHVGGLVAAVILAWIGVRMLAALLRLRTARRSAQVEPWVGRHYTTDGHDLVFIPTPTPVAVTGTRQVVVSTGLVDMLSKPQLTLVVRHELSHLRWSHHRYLTLAAVLEGALGWLPFVESSLSVLRLAVERWADEEAAGPDPRARQTLSEALTAAFYTKPAPGFAGFADEDMVPERIQALRQRPGDTTTPWTQVSAGVLGSAAGAVWLGAMGVIAVSLVSGGGCLV